MADSDNITMEDLKRRQAELNKLHGAVKPPTKTKKQFKAPPKSAMTAAEVQAWEEQNAPVQKPVQLDLFPDYEEVGAMPNTIARSALFSPVCRGRRGYVKEEIVASRKDATITFSGLRLDMGDSDVFMQSIRLAAEYDLGVEFQIQPYGFLSAIGRGGKRKPGKTDLEWLQRSLRRLKAGILTVETDKYLVDLSLIDEYAYDKETGVHQIRINPKIVSLFRREQYGLIDWQKRKEIGVDLGKWLQTYVASNTGPQKIHIEKIREWSGQKDRRLDKFRKTLIKAFERLDELQIVTGFNLDDRGYISYERV
jgi:hypothetical protein